MPLYLLHFDRPYQHARHYLGYSATIDGLHRRVDVHEAASWNDGKGHRLMQAVKAAGIGFVVARIWTTGTREDERRKKQRGHARQCPVCRPGLKVTE